MTKLWMVGPAALLVAGCMTVTGLISPGEIKRATATTINVPSDQILEIYDEKEGLARSSWKARLADGRIFECDAGEMLDDPGCVEITASAS